MNHPENSKWTAVQKINGWHHYEVINIFKKDKKVEMFSVCDKKIKIFTSFSDLKNKKKWISGWIEVVEDVK